MPLLPGLSRISCKAAHRSVHWWGYDCSENPGVRTDAAASGKVRHLPLAAAYFDRRVHNGIDVTLRKNLRLIHDPQVFYCAHKSTQVIAGTPKQIFIGLGDVGVTGIINRGLDVAHINRFDEGANSKCLELRYLRPHSQGGLNPTLKACVTSRGNSPRLIRSARAMSRGRRECHAVRRACAKKRTPLKGGVLWPIVVRRPLS